MKKPSVLYYFKLEWKTLSIVTITGLIYNIGLLAGPYFEGLLAQSIYDYSAGSIFFKDVLHIVITYILVITSVQFARFLKRNYVRIFANNTNKRFKQTIYHNILCTPLQHIEQEGTGALLTKAVYDADDCSEGMRKFTTELFDTCIALLAYVGMLLGYDVKLTLLCLVSVPVSYILAEKMKGTVQKANTHLKQITASLNEETLDRAENALMYRVYGVSEIRTQDYEKTLDQYEKASLQSSIPFMALPPLYQTIALIGIFPILYFGSKNVVQGTWNIAAFTTYLACFIKLSVKSSKSAKLFNAVHKAQVSWKRVSPYLTETMQEEKAYIPCNTLEVHHLSFHYPDADYLFKDISFHMHAGEITGVTGKVACGKTTLGKLFLHLQDYEGTISVPSANVTYLGHDFQLLNDTVYNNIALGKDMDILPYLKMVCMDKEVEKMEQGIHTRLGNDGVRLSKGQAQRIALARTLAHSKDLLVLDDPFSALDSTTEKQVFFNLKNYCKDKMVLLISHRLAMFTQTDQVIYLNNQTAIISDHSTLLSHSDSYKTLVEKGESHDLRHM